MYILLTNASELLKGDKIAINIDLIATVYETPDAVKKASGNYADRTYIFCPPHGTWEVSETIDEVITELNNYKWNKK